MKNIFILITLMTIWKTNGVLSQEHFTHPSFQNNPLYNTLYGTNCSIPEGVQFVHYPMIHPLLPVLDLSKKRANQEDNTENSNLFIDHEVAYSSFQLIQLIKQYPSAVVFDEMFYGIKDTLSFKKKHLRDRILNTYGAPLTNTIAPFLNAPELNNFVMNSRSLKYTNSYTQLTPTEISILSRSTGAMTAYALGLLNHLYPVTIYSDSEEVEEHFQIDINNNLFECNYFDNYNCFTQLAYRFNSSHNETEKETIRQQFYTSYQKWSNQKQKFLDFMFSWREQALVDSVLSVLEEEDFSNNPILIAYGAAHDLTDSFKEQSLYTLPFSCVLHRSMSLLEQVLLRYYLIPSTANNPQNKQILRQYVTDQWTHTNLHQRNAIDRFPNLIYEMTLIPTSEQIRRVIAGEPLWDNKNSEFVFNHLITMDPEELKQSAQITH